MAASNREKFSLFLLFAASLAFVMGPAINATIEAWQKEEYSHGWLVPFVTCVLLANGLRAHKNTPPQSAWLGMGIVTACLIFSFLFTLSGIGGLQPLLLAVYLIGFFVLLYGLRLSAQLAAPLGFLLFIAPLPKFMYYTLSFQMQVASTTLGTALLRLLGVSVFQEGNIIDLGSYKLQVVEACNGLRYLFPLLSFAYLMAYMYKAPLIKRAFLFFSAVPITILMNGLRLLLIGVTVDKWGPAMAEGFVHDFEGWVVFIGCVLVLAAELALLQKIGRNKGAFDLDVLALEPFAHPAQLPRPAFGRPSFATSIALLLGLCVAGGLAYGGSAKIEAVPPAAPLRSFPLNLSAWQGSRETLDPQAFSILGTDEYILTTYTDPTGKTVNLYVLYFAKQDSSSNQAVHNPSVCIPGGGWEIRSRQRKSLTPSTAALLNGKRPELTVNRLLIEKEDQREIVYYWFIQDGQTIADSVLSRLAVIRNALFKNRTNGAMIRLIAPLAPGESETLGDERLERFLKETLPDVEKTLFPDRNRP